MFKKKFIFISWCARCLHWVTGLNFGSWSLTEISKASICYFKSLLRHMLLQNLHELFSIIGAFRDVQATNAICNTEPLYYHRCWLLIFTTESCPFLMLSEELKIMPIQYWFLALSFSYRDSLNLLILLCIINNGTFLKTCLN